MRVGANVRQYHRIKKMHAEGQPALFIANTMQMTPQMLDKILAVLDKREEKILAVEENAEVQALRLRNAELAAKLAKHEEPADGAQSETETVEDEKAVEDSEEVKSGETLET